MKVILVNGSSHQSGATYTLHQKRGCYFHHKKKTYPRILSDKQYEIL